MKLAALLLPTPQIIHMKKLLLAGYTALAAFAAYQWFDANSLRVRLEHSAGALAVTRNQVETLTAQFNASQQQLEDARTKLQEARTEIAHAPHSSPVAKAPVAVAGGRQNPVNASSPFVENLIALADKASRLDSAFKSFPELDIPELALLNEADWIKAVSENPKLESPDEIRSALRSIVMTAKGRAAEMFRNAVLKTSAYNASTTGDLNPLIAELRKEMSEQVLQRYEVIPANRLEPGWIAQTEVKKNLPNTSQTPSIVVREKASPTQSQSVIVFFSMPQIREPGKSYQSSASFSLGSGIQSPGLPHQTISVSVSPDSGTKR
jgi:hypothetical protein